MVVVQKLLSFNDGGALGWYFDKQLGILQAPAHKRKQYLNPYGFRLLFKGVFRDADAGSPGGCLYWVL